MQYTFLFFLISVISYLYVTHTSTRLALPIRTPTHIVYVLKLEVKE